MDIVREKKKQFNSFTTDSIGTGDRLFLYGDFSQNHNNFFTVYGQCACVVTYAKQIYYGYGLRYRDSAKNPF